MANSVNRCFFIGNLCADPEVRAVGESKVANFRIACNESWKDKNGQKQERVEYITIVAWRQLADIADKYLRKGSKIHVEGKLQTRSWEKDGEKRYSTEIACDSFMMLDGRPGTATEANREPSGDPVGYMGPSDDQIPF